MSASTLPFEILVHIASFLSTNDKLTCILTCKAWEPAFQETLWNTVDIRHKGKLNVIHGVLVSKGDSVHSQGTYVRVLVFALGLKVSSEQLRTFQRHCQKIQHLIIREGGLSKDYFLKKPDWELWGALTRLEICLSGLNLVNEPRELIYIISHLPRLRRLDYVDAMMGPRPLYKLQDFEALHNHLPQLEYLSMAVWLDVVPTEDLTIIKGATPANALTTLKLYVDNMDLWWMYYMAQKYSNIITLEMKIDTELRRPNSFREDETSKLLDLSDVFPRLENTLIACRPNTEWSQLTLWDLFRRFDTPLKNLKYDLHSCYDMSGSLERTVSGSIQSCSRTLESFHISSYVDFSDRCKVPRALSFCPNLVDLQITSYITIVALDIFLDHCAVLKNLTLSVSMLSVIASPFHDSTPHGLESLKISRATTNGCILRYTSLRCKNLKYMYLIDVNFFGIINQETGSLCIDMCDTRFKYLELVRVSFYSSSGDRENSLKFLCISWPNYSLISDTMLQGNNDSSLWFHMYSSLADTGPHNNGLMVLSEEEIRLSEKYFSNFRLNSANVFGNQEEDRFYRVKSTWNNWIDWRKSLSLGYATIRCASVEKYHITYES